MHGCRTVLLLTLLLATGCADAWQLSALRGGLVREFHEEGIGVSLTDGLLLTVTFVNGPWAKATCDSQTALAVRVAEYVRDHYQGFDSLLTVSVAFTERRPAALERPTSRHLPFRFARTSLQGGDLGADSAASVALCRDEMGLSSPDSP